VPIARSEKADAFGVGPRKERKRDRGAFDLLAARIDVETADKRARVAASHCCSAA
jgi:hypothetical protein